MNEERNNLEYIELLNPDCDLIEFVWEGDGKIITRSLKNSIYIGDRVGGRKFSLIKPSPEAFKKPSNDSPYIAPEVSLISIRLNISRFTSKIQVLEEKLSELEKKIEMMKGSNS